MDADALFPFVLLKKEADENLMLVFNRIQEADKNPEFADTGGQDRKGCTDPQKSEFDIL